MKFPFARAAKNSDAWQPLTPRGIAAFALAPWRRLLLVQFIFACAVAITVAWCVSVTWFPAIRETIQALPDQGEIQSGRLNWAGRSPAVLSEGHFLAFTVDPNHASGMRSPAHVQVEFGTNTVRLYSLFGYVEREYPRDWIIAFNRPELEPWWGAWHAPILWMTIGAVIFGLLMVWPLLAVVGSIPGWLIGFYANRNLPWSASWKLAGAALMPGVLLMMVALLLYGLGIFDVVQLLAVEIGHLLVGIFYSILSPFFVPPIAESGAVKGNPFRAPDAERSPAEKK